MKKGFTLVEMLFVMSIVMILMLLVIPQVTSKTDAIKKKGCDALLDVIDAAIQLYEINEGRRPSHLSDLVKEGYIKEKQCVCPDGRGIYISDGQAYCN